MTDKTPSRLIVVMEGGCLMGIYSHDPNMVGLRYTTVDYDIEGVEEEKDLSHVLQGDGHGEAAYVFHHTVEPADIEPEAWKAK